MNPHSSPEPTYDQHPDVLFTEIGESEAVLLSLPASRYFTLNETGSLIWQALGEGATPSHIARSLEARYDVEPAQALEHARAFVGELLREELIREREPGHA